MTKKIMLCFLTMIMGLSAKSQTVPTISFVNYLSDDGTIQSVSTALDANSKVYTTGRVFYSTEDIVVQCTDSTGAILWTYTYDNGGTDSPNKIKIDASGNTYVVGVSAGSSGTGDDYIIIKLNSSGGVVWTKRFDRGASGGPDEALDVCIDANGDVYTTGKSRNSSGNLDAVTLKLAASSGNTVWQHIFNPNNLDDIGACMTLAGNQSFVIIGSNSINASTGTDIKTYQLDVSSGAIGWTNTINGTANSTDNVSSIILSGANVVLAGMVNNASTGKDYVVAKISVSSGSAVYKNTYDFSSNDFATSLVRDSTDNIVVTGIALNTSTSLYQYHTILYDSLGTAKWTHKQDINCTSTNVNPVVVCDTLGNYFYISGEKNNANRDVLVYQVSPQGNLGWEKSFNAPTNGADAATGLVVNGIGVIFVSANTTNAASRYNITTIKIAQTPVYFPFDLGTTELNDANFVFQENRGQLLRSNGTAVPTSEVGYYNQGASPSYYFNNSKISHIVIDKDTVQDSLVRVDLTIVGANALADIYHYNPIDAKKHYFTTSALGITDVVSYQRLFIPEIVPNVDLHHYSNTKGLKSYFVFKVPDKSMAGLRLEVGGAVSSSINSGGNLIAVTGLGNINMGAVSAYQEGYNPVTGVFTQTPVTVSWNNVSSNTYGFNISGYVPFWPVVVIVSKPGATSAAATAPNGNLYWSTFIGDQGDEQMYHSRVDAKDNYYISGESASINYPVLGPFQNAPPSVSSVYYGILSKFKNDGKLSYSTYYGGFSSNCSPAVTQIQDIAIDSIYNIYMVGLTTSKSIITKTISVSGALNYTANASTSNCMNAFIAKLNPTGNALRFASYYGGNDLERFNCVAYKNGQIHIGGISNSTSIPLVTPLPNTYQITTGNGMYLHMDTTGSLKHNTKLQQGVVAGAVDKNDNYYLLSQSYGGAGVPTITPAPSFYKSAPKGNFDWGLQRFSAADSLTWSTNIGSTSTDWAGGICIRDSVMALCGYGSGATGFPFQVAPTDSGDVTFGGGTGDAQMMKFNIKTGQILWAAYHATPRDQTARGIALDKDFNLFVTGWVSGNASNNFKLLAKSGYYQQNSEIDNDAYILGYTAQNRKIWATYFGSLTSIGNGLDSDEPMAISVNNSSKLFIMGQTNVKNNSMPMIKWNSVCYFDSLAAAGGDDGFIAMFDITAFHIVGIQEYAKAGASSGLILFPNPNSGIFNIKFTEIPQSTVNLYVMNAMGQTVYAKDNLKTEGNDMQIDLGTLSKGVYLLMINDTQRTRTVKVIID